MLGLVFRGASADPSVKDKSAIDMLGGGVTDIFKKFGESALDSANFCPEDPPMAWWVVTPLDSACACLQDNHPDTALTELKEAERKLRLFECLNESEHEYEMLEDIQMSLLRAELMIQKMEYEKAQDDLAMARMGFEKYYEAIQVQDNKQQI